MAHVGNVHVQFVIAVRQALHPDGVVEIAGGLAVDGYDVHCAEIFASNQLLRPNGDGDLLGLIQDLQGESVRNMMLANYDLDVDAEVIRVSKNLDDAPDGVLVTLWIFEDFDVDDHAVEVGNILHLRRRDADAVLLGCARRQLHTLGNLDPLPQPLIVRSHEIAARSHAKFADHRWMSAPQHFDDLSVGLAIV